MFPENEDTDAEFQTIQFKGRKTGLFIPYWMADPKVDRTILGQRENSPFDPLLLVIRKSRGFL